jgi:hypothetical protein
VCQDACIIGSAEIVHSGVKPLGTVVFVFTPECDSQAVSRHLAAALMAGNHVECALLGETDLAILQLCSITQDQLPSAFAVIDVQHGMPAASTEDAIVIVTSTQVFRNDEPWIRSPHDESVECVQELSRFYSVPSTTRVPWERAPVSFA